MLAAVSQRFHLQQQLASLRCNKYFRLRSLVSQSSRTFEPVFDERLSSILAAYSFEAYNEAFVGKPAIGLDNSKIFFTSLQHIRLAFSGAIIVTVKRVKLTKAEETQFAERLVSGSKPDPYVVSAVYERYSENPIENRVLDSVRSTTKRNTNDAKWEGKGKLSGRVGESYAMYIRDTPTTTLEFSVFDEEVFTLDEFLGNAFLSFSELKTLMQQRELKSGLSESIGLEDYDLSLPIYADCQEETWKESMVSAVKRFVTGNERENRFCVGTLDLSVKYLPWAALTDQQLSNLVVLGQTEVFQESSTPPPATPPTPSSSSPSPSSSSSLSSSSALATNSTTTTATATPWNMNKPSKMDWSQFLAQQMKNQLPELPALPTLPKPAEVLQSVEADLRLRTNTAIQSFQESLTANLPFRVDDEAALPTDEKNALFTAPFLPRGGKPGVADWSSLLQRVLAQYERRNVGIGNKDDDNDVESVPRLVEGLLQSNLHQVCLIDNPDTDTQVALWCDPFARSMIISFRGTQLVRVKDILTDIDLFQAPYRPDHPELAQTRVHQGFLRAYNSIQLALLQQLHDIFDHLPTKNPVTGAMERPWTIYVTGHSLGGALATMCAFDLARIRAGKYTFPPPISTSSSSSSSSSSARPARGGGGSSSFSWGRWVSDAAASSTEAATASASASAAAAAPAAVSFQSHAKSDVFRIPRDRHFANSLVRPEADAALIFLTPDPQQHAAASAAASAAAVVAESALAKALDHSDVVVYTYGAPRVGDPVFKRLFDDLVPHCFRVVNRQDIIARMPRNVTLPVAIMAPEAIAKTQSSTVPDDAPSQTPQKKKKKSFFSSAAAKIKAQQQPQQQPPQSVHNDQAVTKTTTTTAAIQSGDSEAKPPAFYTMYFAHVGRTVLVDEAYVPPATATTATTTAPSSPSPSPSPFHRQHRRRTAGVWIEGENLLQCPLSQDGSVLPPLMNASDMTTKAMAAIAATDTQTLLRDWQAKLQPVVTQAMDVATKNVNELVEKQLAGLAATWPTTTPTITSMATDAEDGASASSASAAALSETSSSSLPSLSMPPIPWASLTSELVQRLREASNVSPSLLPGGSSAAAANGTSPPVEDLVAERWRLLETTLTEWKTAASNSLAYPPSLLPSSASPSPSPSSSSSPSQSQLPTPTPQQQQQQQQWKQILDMAASLGVDTAVLEREVSLLTSVLDRTAIDHHLEGAYFEAMCHVVDCEELVSKTATTSTAATTTASTIYKSATP